MMSRVPDVPDVLVDDVEIGGRAGLSVRVRGGVVAEVGPSDAVGGAAGPTTAPGVARVAGRGAALLPGLHDHHVHLFALGARAESLWCGPPAVTRPDHLVDRLREAARENARERQGGWLRAVGWDDTLAGWPDRRNLDAAVADCPVRLQHRSGALWVLNSAALAHLHLDAGDELPAGVEIGDDGSPTGRITGLDAWLRERIGGEPPSLRAVSADLAAAGVTGVTDATAHNGPTELAALGSARHSGELAQRLTAMTGSADATAPDGVRLGPVKLVLFEAALPPIAEFAARIATAHANGRAVAVHAASRVAVVFAVTALAEAGAGPDDRIEHASVVPPEMLRAIERLGVTVVTQPHFISEHGDRYRATVEVADQPWLYRARTLLDAGIPLAAGSDAPVGELDPWAAMAAAVERRTAEGHVMGPDERLSPEQALGLFTGHPARPGGPPREIRPGEPADLCLLDRPWATARRDLADVRVEATIIGGRVVYDGT
ncbi:MAG: amidohydrolase family protein [Acidimicrobiia bacterium]